MALLHTEAILSPEGTSTNGQAHLAPRRYTTLDGVRLGLLGNSKLNADNVLLAVGELLQQRYALKSVFVRSKPYFGTPVPDPIAQEMLENSDVVIAGVGD